MNKDIDIGILLLELSQLRDHIDDTLHYVDIFNEDILAEDIQLDEFLHEDLAAYIAKRRTVAEANMSLEERIHLRVRDLNKWDRCYLVSEILAMEHSAEEAIEKIRASVTEDD